MSHILNTRFNRLMVLFIKEIEQISLKNIISLSFRPIQRNNTLLYYAGPTLECSKAVPITPDFEGAGVSVQPAQGEHGGSSQEKVGQEQEPNHLCGEHQLGVFLDVLVN